MELAGKKGLPILPANYKSLGIKSVQYVDPACKIGVNQVNINRWGDSVKEWAEIPNESKDLVVPFNCPIYALFRSQMEINNPIKSSADTIIENMWRVCKPGGSIIIRAQKNDLNTIQQFFETFVKTGNQPYSIQINSKHSSENPPIQIYKEGFDPLSIEYYIQIIKQNQAGNKSNKSSKMATGLPAPAKKTVIPGVSEDRISILDPVAYTEYTLHNLLRKTAIGILRTKNTPIFKKYGAELSPNLLRTPGLSPETYVGMLFEEKDKNFKSYLPIQNTQPFTRISSSTDRNICWFDSFLTCMSPSYRKISLVHRKEIVTQFRNLCKKNKEMILTQIPSFFPKNFIKIFNDDIDNLNGPIETHTGFLIAWYFGVNIIYYVLNDEGLFIFNDPYINYQSPDCKTIFMTYIDESKHYEPLGILGLTSDNKYDEPASTFVFDWSDPRLCALPGRPDTWTLPICADSNAGSTGSANTNNTAARASVGGNRSRHRRTKKHGGKKRGSTRRH